MSEIRNLNPECIWRNFDALTQVPRPSGHLEKVQQFLLDFAARVGVEGFKDAAGNIVMRKPASAGMENKKGVILQAHMDMVPQKSKESTHNFETDPIETYVDGEWVRAKGTTLGADNGIGVAAIMAVMEDKTLVHGPVEGLITADEETGMFGANDLPCDELQGDILLNLDSETWGKFVIGSAGGIDITATLAYKEMETDKEDAAVKVLLKGLIPFECEVVLTLPKENVEALKENVEEWRKLFNHEFRTIEENIQFFTEDVETPAFETPEEIQDNLLDAIYGCHNGVLRMIPVFPSVVETSSNLAIINIEGGHAYFKLLARSANESMKEYIATTLESTFSMAGMKVEMSGSYGGWDPNTDSEILHLMEQHYRELFGEEAIEQVDHAGLECSVILGKYPHLDVVSFGPTMRSPHTTSERCLIKTIAPFWELVKKTLAEVPAK